jgi:hypothetical protein
MGIGTTTASAAVTVQGGAGANIFSLNTSAGANILNVNSTGRLSVATTAAAYGTELALNGLGSLRLSSPVGSDNIFTFNSRGVDNFSIRGTNGADAYLNSVNNSTLFLGAASTPAGAIVNQMAFRPDGRITVGGGTVQAAGNILSIASSTITGTNALLSIGTSTTGGILSVLANGNVGIGTTTPDQALSLNGNNVAMSLRNSGNGSMGWLSKFTDRFALASANDVIFYASSTNGTDGTALRLSQNGNLTLTGPLSTLNLEHEERRDRRSVNL